MDQINLSAWTNRSDVATGGVSEQQAQMIHAVLGQSNKNAPAEGEVMPHLWHWYGFAPTAPMAELGTDGHPKLGDFMPPLRLNRRMWAGGSLEFRKPLHVGEPLTKRTTISNISEKSGAAGEMVIVSLDHEISGSAGVAVLERRNIVYLQIPDSYTPPKSIAAPTEYSSKQAVEVTTPLLFRYSAITFNAHRIHYDLPYTREVEHYPDLVVHGPLQAQLLMDMATQKRGAAPCMFSYRGVHPLFASDALDLRAAQESASEWQMCAVAQGAHQTMQATAIWEV